jgi:hypothetical protein
MKEAYRLLDRILEGSVAVHLLSGIRDLLVNELVVSFELTSEGGLTCDWINWIVKADFPTPIISLPLNHLLSPTQIPP